MPPNFDFNSNGKLHKYEVILVNQFTKNGRKAAKR